MIPSGVQIPDPPPRSPAVPERLFDRSGLPVLSLLSRLIDAGPLVHLAAVNPDGSPQVSVTWIGLDPYAVLHTRATVEPSGQAWDLLNRLTKVYMSPDAEFPASRTRLHRAVRGRADRRHRPVGTAACFTSRSVCFVSRVSGLVRPTPSP